MKRKCILLIVLIMIISGCNNKKIEDLEQNIRKIELTGNLVTYQAYYHNVIESEKEKGEGMLHWFEKDRTLFAEYTGTIKLGINLSKVKIDVRRNKIDVFIPKATIIGEPNVDKDDFDPKNFIESKEGVNKNPITANDANEAFEEAQAKIKKETENDKELLDLAQKRAKIILEENILQFSGLKEKDLIINWEYEQ